MKFKRKTLNEIAIMICGDFVSNGNFGPNEVSFFEYRSSSYLTEFFQDCELNRFTHDGSTRKWWVVGVLEDILSGPSSNQQLVPDAFIMVVRVLMDQSDALNESKDRPGALAVLNMTLAREGYEAYYDEGGVCQLRDTKSRVSSEAIMVPQRAWTKEEQALRSKLSEYFDTASEDDIIEEVLLPLFRQLGFQRITSAGHKDKALEYGKDVWMKFRLPTSHNIYFGIQVKRGKLDAAGRTKNANISEILAQIRMMLGHMIFDPETNKRALVDHAIIIAGGEITKQARNWLAEQLDTSQRSQILFMERSDIQDLMLTNKVPLPSSLEEISEESLGDEIPF